MRAATLSLAPLALIAVAWLTPPPAPQDASSTEPPARELTAEQLENLVAPVALYPDVLLSQVLNAAQFPKEITAASDLATAATSDKAPDAKWSNGIKALLIVPPALQYLDEHLSWTTRLGIASKARAPDVLTAVRTVRRKAQAAGNLVSNADWTVEGQDDALKIVPTTPNRLVVPLYDANQLYVTHDDECPQWLVASEPITFPNARSVEVAFRSAEWDKDTDPAYQHHHYDGPAGDTGRQVATYRNYGGGLYGPLFRHGHLNWGFNRYLFPFDKHWRKHFKR